ncbi:MAG: aspartate kinase [Candidatus Tectomicrobia bacterium]|uniref:Aspartokinase n=1 Tax=Tectimicrobiota bacterium TaxID=2528274 RepID=A0A937W7G9_UNCTE|nr:aspartate kinase [Candidatus Tectomicrobia bacterium]
MGVVVQKYGGTSVGSIERMRAVAARVQRTRQQGHQVVVVVSAMAGETDRLLKLASEASPAPVAREVDTLLATGEMVSIALVAMVLREFDCPAASLTGAQGGILTDNAHTHARIKQITPARVQQALAAGIVPVVAGFQGIHAGGDVTTLGRGGSDLTAVALAAALQADLCEIYTDVDGVYSADPNIVPQARRLNRISYDEMLEMARLGAKVLQARSVEFAKKYDVPVVVKSSFTEGSGTLVTRPEQDMEQVVVAGVTSDRNQAKVTLVGVPDRPGIAAKLFGRIATANIIVDMIIQNASEGGLTDISFTVSRSDAQQTLELARQSLPDLGASDATLQTNIAKVSIVGAGMQSHAGVAARMFEALAAETINILMISTSEIKISCVVEDKYTELAVRVLHNAFQLDQEAVL